MRFLHWKSGYLEQHKPRFYFIGGKKNPHKKQPQPKKNCIQVSHNCSSVFLQNSKKKPPWI